MLDSTQRAKILKEIWGLDEAEVTTNVFYFNWLESRLPCMPFPLQHFCLDTLIVLATTVIHEARETCEAYIRTELDQLTTDDFQINECLSFVTEVFFCINVRSSEWKRNERLSDFVNRYIAVPCTSLENVRFPKVFNARAFDEDVGLKIQWTTFFNEHLELTGDDDTIKLFPFSSIIRLYESSKTVMIWPNNFLAETHDTLSLLFPNNDRKARVWLAKQKPLDPAVLRYPRLPPTARYAERFVYWGGRLLELKEAFDNPEPRSLLQLCLNYKKPLQFATFWIASLAFLLSLIACIEGAIQVYKAYHPTEP